MTVTAHIEIMAFTGEGGEGRGALSLPLLNLFPVQRLAGEGRKEEKGTRSEEGGEGEEGEGEGGNKIQICYIIVQYLKMFVIFVQ